MWLGKHCSFSKRTFYQCNPRPSCLIVSLLFRTLRHQFTSRPWGLLPFCSQNLRRQHERSASRRDTRQLSQCAASSSAADDARNAQFGKIRNRCGSPAGRCFTLPSCLHRCRRKWYNTRNENNSSQFVEYQKLGVENWRRLHGGSQCGYACGARRNGYRSSHHRKCLRPHHPPELPSHLSPYLASAAAHLHLLPSLRPHLYPLYRNLPERQHPRHDHLRPALHARLYYYCRRPQIRRNQHRQPRALPVQGQPLHADVWYHHLHTTTRAVGDVRTLRTARLPDRLRELQRAAAAGPRPGLPHRAHDGRARRRAPQARRCGQYGAVRGAGGGADLQHAAAPARPGPIQSSARLARRWLRAAFEQGHKRLGHELLGENGEDCAGVRVWRRGESARQERVDGKVRVNACAECANE